MRDIKFRGLDRSKKWYYGSLVKTENIEPVIYFEVGKGRIKKVDWAYVSKETIGQFTGLQTKSKQEIYEGDILEGRNGHKYTVVFESGGFYLYNVGVKDYDGTPLKWGLLNRLFDVDMTDIYEETKIIGNIHENKELLK